ncbi:hypothetical protein CR513_05529, partial [Mucuna pruriens]
MPGEPSMNNSLWGKALKIAIYILNKVPIIAINKIPYELWIEKIQASNTCTFRFYDPTSRSFLETGSSRFLEEVEFEKEENIRNVNFEKEFVNDIGQVLIPITVQETTIVIEDNVQTNVPDITYDIDYLETFSLVAKLNSIQVLLFLAANLDWSLQQRTSQT